MRIFFSPLIASVPIAANCGLVTVSLTYAVEKFRSISVRCTQLPYITLLVAWCWKHAVQWRKLSFLRSDTEKKRYWCTKNVFRLHMTSKKAIRTTYGNCEGWLSKFETLKIRIITIDEKCFFFRSIGTRRSNMLGWPQENVVLDFRDDSWWLTGSHVFHISHTYFDWWFP